MVFSLSLSELVANIMVKIVGFMYEIIVPMFILMMIVAPIIIIVKVIRNVAKIKDINY